jgi:2-oxoglutarate/2-oxoacid ferredoxin oxidoreductase subunit beta
VDQPINPVKQLLAAGATFIARTASVNPNHLLAMMEAAMDHEGFGVIECMSECVHFNPGSFEALSQKNGGFKLVPESHDVTDEVAAYKLADDPYPGYFGVFYKKSRPTKNQLEAGINAKYQAKFKGKKDWEILQDTFNKLK